MIIQQMIHVGQTIEIYVLIIIIFYLSNYFYINSLNFINISFCLAMTINAVTAIQIPHQLEGKQKALDLFVSFLKEHNLWDRVSIEL